MNDNRKVINLKDYKEKKEKLEPRTFVYIPMAYRQACLDIVKRHNPKASKEKIILALKNYKQEKTFLLDYFF